MQDNISSQLTQFLSPSTKIITEISAAENIIVAGVHSITEGQAYKDKSNLNKYQQHGQTKRKIC